MKNCLTIVLLLLVSIAARAQQTYADSLKQALKNATTDSLRFKINIDLESHYTEQNRDSALWYVDKALLLAQKNNKSLDVARSLDSKGYILMKLGRYTESYQSFQSAFKIAENPGNENKTWFRRKGSTPRQIRLEVLENIHHDYGHLMGVTGKTDQKIFQYHETKRIAEEIGDTNMLGFVNMNLGTTYLRLGKLDSALTMSENAARIFNQTRDRRYLGGVYQDMGDVFRLKGNFKKAAEYYHKGIPISLEENNFSDLSGCYYALTAFYLEDAVDKDSSLHYARKNLTLLKSMESRDLGSAYSYLYRSYQLNNALDSAYKYMGLALVTNDSINAERIKSLSALQSLAFDEQVRLQELEKAEIRRQSNNRTYGMLAGLTVLLIIGLILYRNNLQKQKANKVLETTLANLQSTQSQLIQSEKLASLGELTAGIAHEIQNPLNFVNNFSEISNELMDEMTEEMARGNNDEVKVIAGDIKQNLEKINQHGKRASSIVTGMLQHARASSGKKEPTDINALADEYLRLSYHGLRAKDPTFNAKMTGDFDPAVGKLDVIPQDIGRVLLNLINNAFYAVSQRSLRNNGSLRDDKYEPTVIVSTKKLGDKVEIRVQDNGTGIPDSVKAKIFQPFFTTKPTGQGTGLGLSLAYDIVVKGHGGDLKVETKEGEGTTFVIQLPIS